MTGCGDDTCITCSDAAEPMTVVSVDGRDALCRPEGGAGESVVDVALVEPVAAGDVLLVHAGVALAVR